MKTALFIFCLLGVARGESDSASGKSEVVRVTVSEQLKREFRYEPQPSVAPPATEAEVVVLPRFEVMDSSIKGAAQAVRGARKKVEDEKFSWKKGGTILKLGPMKVMFKYDPESNSLYLLRF
jgi:hypothetical protein